MKRLLAIFGILFLVVFAAKADAQSVQNFHFSDFHADYYLSKDDEGRSRLKVVETITAEFPEYDQNKGLVRAIPQTYDGHPLEFKLKGLTRSYTTINGIKTGVTEPVYDQYSQDGHIVIETGTDDYVRGTQEYEFTYTLRDVTKDFGEHQEFFWDVNGTEWRQPFDNASATVHLDESVASAFTGETRCFAGALTSNTRCGQSSTTENTATFETTKRLPVGYTLSLVMKFEADTFAPYDEGQLGLYRTLAAGAAYLVAAATTLYALWVRFTRGNDAKGKGVIIPQYVPPKDVSVWTISSVAKKMNKAMPAQIVDLAVRKKLRILEEEKKVWFFKSKKYTLELLSVSGLKENEQKIVSILFGSVAKPGAKYEMKKSDRARQKKLYAFGIATKKALITEEYRREIEYALLAFITPFVSGGIGVWILSNMSNTGVPADWRSWSLAAAFVSLFTVLFTLTKQPLTKKGRELTDYLKGLEDYIKLAEAERLKFLQSPDGAQKVSVDPDDKKQMVKLYEKLLPYAILFGQEKEWAKLLEMYYQDTGTPAPAWYAGAGAFNASGFASSIGSFTSTSSSSSGFSGGGGAGGGGGGGGGGGR